MTLIWTVCRPHKLISARSGSDLNACTVQESGASDGGRFGLGAREMVSPVAAGAVHISGAALESGVVQNPLAAGATPRVQVLGATGAMVCTGSGVASKVIDHLREVPRALKEEVSRKFAILYS
ncbi:hypothetical protein RIF29_30123 [Crotalaria pallida]|uniref:Uncharacterized protein n=1 Tax=Crotalaria pallida TaxID=3830 RepID=A0AAN9EML6_CROPI